MAERLREQRVGRRNPSVELRLALRHHRPDPDGRVVHLQAAELAHSGEIYDHLRLYQPESSLPE